MTATLVRRSQHAHILVCRSCGEACIRPGAEGAEHLSATLRKTLENAFLNGQNPAWNVRIVESGCLDICPVGAISVRLVGAENSEHKTLTWTVSSDQNIHELIQLLSKHLIRAS